MSKREFRWFSTTFASLSPHIEPRIEGVLNQLESSGVPPDAIKILNRNDGGPAVVICIFYRHTERVSFQ